VQQGVVDGSDEVLKGSGGTGGRGENVFNTSELKELLGNGSADNTSTSGGGDQSDSDGTALASDLDGDGMDVTDLVTPIASSDWDQGELSSNEGTLDGNLDFLGELDTETDVTVLITDGNDGLESGSLTGLGLLLNGHDLHGLVRELSVVAGEEQVNNLGLLNGDGVSVDLLE
jgi:hypothetical protein